MSNDAGLIGGLAMKRGWHSSHGVTPARYLDRRDVLDLLRSDETVEAVARAIFLSSHSDAEPSLWDDLHPALREPELADARAALRVLVGDPTDSEAAK